jgi:hypothetical protein
MKTSQKKHKKNAHLSTAPAALLALAFAGSQASAQAAPQPPVRVAAAKAAKPRAPGKAAFQAADAGYKAYERREYGTAVDRAEEAVRLAPAKRDYWVLLINSLTAAGRYAEADQAIERGTKAAGSDAMFAQSRESLRRAQAQASGAEMYKALQAGDVKGAIAHARAAVNYAPEHPAYRLALVQALLRGDNFVEAEKIAGETIALLPDSAAPLALRAYARQRMGHWPEARADLDRALQQKGLSAASQRELRLIAADASMAAGEPAHAVALLQALPAGDAAAGQRLALARQLAAAPNPAALRGIALQAPSIDCSNVAQSQTCAVVAAPVPADPGYAAASAAYRAMDAHDYAQALEQARAAAAASPANRDYQLLHLNAAVAAHQPQEAEAAASAALALDPQDAQVLAQRAAVRRDLGNVAGAAQDTEAALAAGKLSPAAEAGLLADAGRKAEARSKLAAAQGHMPPLDLAYLATRVGDDKMANLAFAQADAAKALPPTALQDAGYAAIRARRDQEAVDYLKRAVVSQEALQLKMEPQMLYATRRTISEVERKFGVLASLTYASSPGSAIPGAGIVNSGNQRTLQAGAEAYWRPWGFMNGRFVELFVRGFETLDGDSGTVTGGDSFSGGIGARWKPLTQHNVVLSFSRLFGSNTASKWLAQAAYSLDRGSDLRVDVPSWWTTRVAFEVGRYLQPTQSYGLASVMAGRSYRLGDGNWVAFPHGVLAGEYNSALADTTAFAAGAGVSMRRWFREDKYHAPRSYLDFTLEYRAHLGGDDRMRGPYVNALVSY